MGKIAKKSGLGPATQSKKNDQSETDLNSFNIATNTIAANRVEPEHTMGEEFLCDWCGLVFNSKVLQHEHILSIHQYVVIDNLEESSKCQECGLSFQTKQILQEHISSAHPDIITIPHEDSVSVNSIVSRKNDVNQIIFLYFHMNNRFIVQGFLKYFTLIHSGS